MVKNKAVKDLKAGQSLFKVEGLVKKYNTPEGDLEIIKGIDLTLDECGLYFIVGKSGSGKSTLLHILGGLDIPTAGTVYYEGVDIYKLREREIAKYCLLKEKPEQF